MTGWEAGTLAVARMVVQRAAAMWLSQRRSAGERSRDLSELVALRVSDRFRRRSLERQIEEIADGVAQRLEPLCRYEFRNLEDHDRAAALHAVVDTFAAADLSDEGLFAVDVDATKLARTLRASLPHVRTAVGLGDAGSRFFDLVLAECCDCYVRIVMQLAAFGPRASVEMLDRLGRLGEQVALVLARLPTRQLNASLNTDQDRDFEHRYLHLVSERLDELELFGVDVHHYRPRMTLSVAYISLTVTSPLTTARGRRGYHSAPNPLERWHNSARPWEAGVVRVETALSAGTRVLVRGEAGSGKTTLLVWLAVTSARGGFHGGLRAWNGCVPLLVKLRSYAESPLPPPERFLEGVAAPIAGTMPLGWVQRILDAGRGLLLVDGVDELPAGRRRTVRDWLTGLVAAYPTTRILITSRPRAAGADWLTAEGFESVMLEPMGPADIRALIRHWHDAVRGALNLPCAPGDLPGYEASLFARLDAAPHLRALAASPLLCAMLCALNLDRRTHLPRDRMSLYAAAVNLLLERRDVERGVSSADLSLTVRDKICLLQDLAWRLSLNNRAELPTDQVAAHLARKLATMPHVSASAEDTLDHLLVRSGVIREPIPGKVDFIHRTVQEYLAAKEIAEEAHVGLLLDRAHLDQWSDIVVMTAGHANIPLRVQLITGLLDRADRGPRHGRRLGTLAGACLETALTLPPELHTRINERLATMLPPANIRESRSLASIGEPMLLRLPTDLSELSEAAAAATVRTVALVNGPKAINLLAGYATDPRPRVQRELARAWKYFNPHDYARRVLTNAPLVEGRLTLTDPGLLPAVHHLHNLRHLSMTLDDVGNLTCLDGVPALTELNIENTDVVDLAPLADHRQLEHLRLMPIRNVSGIHALNHLHDLMSLWLPAIDPLPDISFLSTMTLLEDLWLGDVEGDIDLSLLTELPRLTMLNFAYREQQLEPTILRRLPHLIFFGTRHDGRTGDLRLLTDALADLPQFTDLGLWNCHKLTDLTPLTPLRLTRLRLIGVNSLTDLKPLAQLTNLEDLVLNASAVTDLTAVAQLANLRNIDLEDCTTTPDLSPLSALPKLQRVVLSGAAPGLDLSPLEGCRGLQVLLTKGQMVEGTDSLRPGVRIRWS